MTSSLTYETSPEMHMPEQKIEFNHSTQVISPQHVLGLSWFLICMVNQIQHLAMRMMLMSFSLIQLLQGLLGPPNACV